MPQRHEDLDRLLDRGGHSSWCFVTAWNPASTVLSASENRKRNAALRNELVRAGRTFHEGVGRGEDPSGNQKRASSCSALRETRRSHWGEVGDRTL